MIYTSSHNDTSLSIKIIHLAHRHICTLEARHMDSGMKNFMQKYAHVNRDTSTHTHLDTYTL